MNKSVYASDNRRPDGLTVRFALRVREKRVQFSLGLSPFHFFPFSIFHFPFLIFSFVGFPRHDNTHKRYRRSPSACRAGAGHHRKKRRTAADSRRALAFSRSLCHKL